VEWWVYAILVILFFGLFGRGDAEPRSKVEDPTTSQRAKTERKGSRFALGLKWKRNPGNAWERERDRHHPVGAGSDRAELHGSSTARTR
jgi:hypothetical protein